MVGIHSTTHLYAARLHLQLRFVFAEAYQASFFCGGPYCAWAPLLAVRLFLPGTVFLRSVRLPWSILFYFVATPLAGIYSAGLVTLSRAHFLAVFFAVAVALNQHFISGRFCGCTFGGGPFGRAAHVRPGPVASFPVFKCDHPWFRV